MTCVSNKISITLLQDSNLEADQIIVVAGDISNSHSENWETHCKQEKDVNTNSC